jgi:hypothetical protein
MPLEEVPLFLAPCSSRHVMGEQKALDMAASVP